MAILIHSYAYGRKMYRPYANDLLQNNKDLDLIISNEGLVKIAFNRLDSYFNKTINILGKIMHAPVAKVLFVPFKAVENTIFYDHANNSAKCNQWMYQPNQWKLNNPPSGVAIFDQVTDNETSLLAFFPAFLSSVIYFWPGKNYENNIFFYAKVFDNIDTFERLNETLGIIKNGDFTHDFDFVVSESCPSYYSSAADLLLAIINIVFDENIPKDKFFEVLECRLGSDFRNNIMPLCNQIIEYESITNSSEI